MPSIDELRLICQRDIRGKDIWSWWTVQRRISIYFTRAFVSLHIQANVVTLLNLFIGVVAAMWIAIGYSVAGLLLFQLFFVLDCSDGEVARYFGSSGYRGLFLDRIVHIIVEPTFFIAVAIAAGDITLGIIPAICCENGLRLVMWAYAVSKAEEPGHSSEVQRGLQPWYERIARFFAVYGFVWLALVAPIVQSSLLIYLLAAWNVLAPCACAVTAFELWHAKG